jgi:hypothetical protein
VQQSLADDVTGTWRPPAESALDWLPSHDTQPSSPTDIVAATAGSALVPNLLLLPSQIHPMFNAGDQRAARTAQQFYSRLKQQWRVERTSRSLRIAFEDSARLVVWADPKPLRRGEPAPVPQDTLPHSRNFCAKPLTMLVAEPTHKPTVLDANHRVSALQEVFKRLFGAFDRPGHRVLNVILAAAAWLHNFNRRDARAYVNGRVLDFTPAFGRLAVIPEHGEHTAASGLRAMVGSQTRNAPPLPA